MTRRLTLLALGAALWTWAGAGLPTAAQDKHTSHGGTKRSTHSAHEQVIERLTAGMSAAEKKHVHRHLAQMSAADRKVMLDHMLRMPAAERRKLAQQMMKGGGSMGGHGGHGGHGRGSGGASHAKPSSDRPGNGGTHNPVPLAIGDQVPDFVMSDLQGKTRRLSDLRKQTKSGIVSLTFWCSFCHSCRSIEARLDRFARDHKDQAVVAAIDASAGETVAGVTAFAKKTGLSLPILMDAPGKTADVFGVEVTTTTVVIDGQGVLRYRGQLLEGDRMPARDALKAVIAGTPVARKETPQHG